MKIYAIYDKDLERKEAIGYLYCYDKSGSYVIELCEDINQWEAPLLFQGLVKKKIYTVPKDLALLWVRERIIPTGRQNIGLILKNAKLKEYNERALLALSEGRCSQDQCMIKEISEKEVPGNIAKRMESNISECFLSEDGQIICLFRDNMTSKIDLKVLAKKNNKIQQLLKKKKLLESVRVGVGGYSVAFQDYTEISKEILREKRWILPISAKDFYLFVHGNIISSVGACERMECTKQNLSYFVKSNRIEPVIYGSKENFYTKGSVQKLIDD